MAEDFLQVIKGPGAGARLDVQGELLIGRRASTPGQLGGDSELSRRHALINRPDAHLTIVDLGSTNGTRVNGRLIEGPTELRRGDRIALGGSILEVRSSAVEQTASHPGAHGRSSAFAPPPVEQRRPSGTGISSQLVLAMIATAAVAAVAILLATRGAASGGPSVAGGPFDGTAYIENNVAAPNANSVLAFRYREGSFRPLRITEYPTGGSGSHDLNNAGVLDADQQVIVNDARTLLFAVNQGSDTIAVFHISADGTLTPVQGSPFPSGGTAPASLGISGNILVVANKAHDGVRDLTQVQANYTTFRVAGDGTLHPTGFTFVLPPRSSPTQVYVAPGGRLVFTTEETGLLRAFTLTPAGQLVQAPGSPQGLPNSIFGGHVRPNPVWPAGLSASADQPILYSGVPNNGSIVAYDYDTSGRLRFDSGETDPKAFLPCWSVVSADGRRLYFANAGTDNISVWDIATDPRHPRLLQTVPLRGGGNPWNLRLDPSGNFLYIITPRQVGTIPAGQGQLLHSLHVGSDGRLAELQDSPVPLPVALDTNPLGLAIVPRG